MSFVLEDNVIIGNICFYGVMGGNFYVNGWVGECFVVCNFVGKVVIEGVGDYCCEYMIGGVIVVFGFVGWNVGVGMIGGLVYFFDEVGDLLEKINLEIIIL